jgi:hypothetical protein
VSTYFICWRRHDDANEPVKLYEELDVRRIETRKVHEYGDGQAGLLSDRSSTRARAARMCVGIASVG